MKYSLLDQIVMESDYNSMRLNHFMQCNIDSFAFETADIFMDADSGVITEHDANILYENAFTDIVDKLMAFIQKIIDNIAKFFNELKIRIFGSPKEKEKLKKLKEAAKAASNKGIKGNAVTKKVKVFKIKRNKKALDAYIKEMSKLERRMLNLKYQAAQDSTRVSDIPVIGKKIASDNTTASTMIEYTELTKAIDECNRKYDRVVKSNAEVVELALNDAIRFSDKDLDSIGLDLDEIKKGSDRVLAKFKSDAKGVKTKQQANLIQKAVQSIETRVRKSMKEGAEYQTKNSSALFAFFTAAGVITAGGAILKLTGKDQAIKDAIGDKLGGAGGLKDKAVDAVKGKMSEVSSAGNAALHKKDLDNAINPSVAGYQTLQQAIQFWINSDFPLSAGYAKNVKDYLDAIIDTSKVTKMWQVPFAIKHDTALTIYGYIIESNGPIVSAKVNKFLQTHPDMGIDFNSVSENGVVTNVGLHKFLSVYVTKIAGVKDLSKFIQEMENCRKSGEKK